MVIFTDVQYSNLKIHCTDLFFKQNFLSCLLAITWIYVPFIIERELLLNIYVFSVRFLNGFEPIFSYCVLFLGIRKVNCFRIPIRNVFSYISVRYSMRRDIKRFCLQHLLYESSIDFFQPYYFLSNFNVFVRNVKCGNSQDCWSLQLLREQQEVFLRLIATIIRFVKINLSEKKSVEKYGNQKAL